MYSMYTTTGETESVEKRTKLRFSCSDDINLLKQTLLLNPYKDHRNWRAVHMNLLRVANKPFTVRAIKDHVEHLLMLYRKKDFGNLRRAKSATESQRSEKEQLLQELHRVKEICILRKKKREQMTQTSPEPVEEEAEVNTVHLESTNDQDSSDPDSSIMPLPSVSPFISSALENNQMDINSGSTKTSAMPINTAGTCKDASTEPILEILDADGDDFEKRKLSLEEKKVELESRRLALEEVRLKYFMESQKQQQQLLLVLIEKITGNKADI